MIINNICPFCGKRHNVTTTIEGYRTWIGGALIQDAMPFLSSTEREQLISGICPDCQAKIFGSDNEDFFPNEEEDDL